MVSAAELQARVSVEGVDEVLRAISCLPQEGDSVQPIGFPLEAFDLPCRHIFAPGNNTCSACGICRDDAVRAWQVLRSEDEAMAKKSSGGGRSKSLHNPATFDALVRQGMPEDKAARISNGLVKHGVKKGVHHPGGKKK